MSEVSKIHKEAMNFAEMALVAKIKGNTDEARQYLCHAFEKEKIAAKLLVDMDSPEPTRSILFRSAASLAIECNELREAEKLIALGLSGSPPIEIAEELRDLFEKVTFNRHLDLRGITLEPEELQLSIAGKGISAGLAPSELLMVRIENTRKLIYRTIERLLGKPYREVGSISSDIREYGLFISTPRVASFAVSLRVSRPNPLPGFESELKYVNSADVIDEVMSCLNAFNNTNEDELKVRIKQDAYYRNFIGLAKNMSPDGDQVRQVGFTTLRKGKETRVSLTTPRDQIKLAREIKVDLPKKKETKLISVIGRLLYANAINSGKESIQLVDDNGKSHNIIVPEGMMSDIVKPLWEERVKVTGYYVRNSIRLEDINIAD